MAKEEGIVVNGVVSEVLPSNKSRVKLDDMDREIICYLSGRMRKNKIRVLMGDKVEIMMSPYDLTQGRITRRN